jgi:glycosyltransferase involved in cell wall biosynthesis
MNQIADLARVHRERQRALRVAMLGMRGFPNVQGGVEKHAEKLSCALADLGCEVEAIVRIGYVAKGQPARWHNVRLLRVWAPRVTGIEAFVHTFLGVLCAGWRRPDILHIHAIGPALFTPLARALGLRVVVTCHSRNYEHKKWGRLGRAVLRLGERAAMAFANDRIAVSDGLSKNLSRTYGVPVRAIPNGIEPPRRVRSVETLRAFGLTEKRYLLMVARIDQDKCQLDLVAAFARLSARGWKLALVGAADYSSGYSCEVAEAAARNPGIVLLGHQTGSALAELYTHAGGFVLPSRFEGQPISVLEAASYGLPLILSDIAAHRELALPRAHYFAVGDIIALAAHLEAICAARAGENPATVECAVLMAKHDWRAIAQRTLTVYWDALSGSKRGRGAGDSPAAKITELP